jgi:hypothetical protein
MEGERKKLGVRDEGGEKKKDFKMAAHVVGVFFFYDFKRKKIYFPIFSFQCRLSIF